MSKIKCPCCGYYTHDNEQGVEIFIDICDVCFWQFDEVAQDKPDKVIGPNEVSLNQARENYEKIGAITERFKDAVRKPLPEEYSRNN